MDEAMMVHRLNSIARFFAAYPRDEAVAGIEGHLRDFWEPRMRRRLQEYLNAGGDGLDELVLEAARRLQPTSVPSVPPRGTGDR